MTRIVITGGTGFVGREVCARLARQDPQVVLRVATRARASGHRLAGLPNVELVECDVHDPAVLPGLLAGAGSLVHLVAILHGSAEAFSRVHVRLPQALAAACAAAGVGRVVHVSALGVSASAPSNYLRSKAAGEAVWLDSGLDVTVLRPSVIFGAEDRFTNLFVKLQRLAPVMPLAGAQALFQPVWVDDVAQAVASSLGRPAADRPGPVIECAGPEVMSLEQIVKRVGTMAGCARPVIALPEALGRMQAAVLGLLPGEPLMSRDNLLSMRVPNVASGTLPGLAALGIRAASIAALADHFQRPR